MTRLRLMLFAALALAALSAAIAEGLKPADAGGAPPAAPVQAVAPVSTPPQAPDADLARVFLRTCTLMNCTQARSQCTRDCQSLNCKVVGFSCDPLDPCGYDCTCGHCIP